MFIVNLKFSENKSRAKEYMEGHNQWISKGFEEGVFLMAGSLQPGLGGSVLGPVYPNRIRPVVTVKAPI